MAALPNVVKENIRSQFLWAGVILMVTASLFILVLLTIRPSLDPVILITLVTGIGTSVFASVAAYLKAQETHLSVNSQLTEWKKEVYTVAFTEGVMAGKAEEQARVEKELELLKRLADRVVIK